MSDAATAAFGLNQIGQIAVPVRPTSRSACTKTVWDTRPGARPATWPATNPE
jgi:hypothetical protein